MAEEGAATGGVQFLNLGHIAASLIASTKIWARPHLLISVGQVADGVEDTAGYALHSVHDMGRLIEAAWKVAAIEMIVGVWAVRRRRIPSADLGAGLRGVVDHVAPMLPIRNEGAEVFRIAPFVDLLRGTELLNPDGRADINAAA